MNEESREEVAPLTDEPVPGATGPNRSPPVARINFLNALRGVAVLLVLWDHMVASFPVESGFGYRPAIWTEKWIFGPLGITQDGGFLGVAIFFLVSGFIVTRVAERENVAAFAIRRLLRIFPPLAVVVLVTAWWHPTGQPAHTGVWEVLSNIFLLNYVSVPQIVLVGVGWTLIIEVIFYLLVAVAVSLFRLRPYAVLAVEVVAIVAVQLTDRSLGPQWFAFSVSMSYVPLLLVGQIIHYRDQLRISRNGAVLAGLTVLGLWEWSVPRIYPTFLAPPQSYPISAAVALAVFLLALRAPADFGSDRLSRYLADRSYAIYLVHGLVGFWALAALHRNGVPYTLCLIVAALVVLVAAELSWWLVERPSRRLAHLLTSRRRTTPGVVKMASSR